MVKSEYRLRLGVCLLFLATGVPLTQGQGHCTKVSKDVTVYFGIETDLPDPNHPVTVDLYHTDFEVSFRPDGWDVLISYDAPGAGAGGQDIPLEEALLYGNAHGRWVLSSIPQGFEFIGARAEEPFWVLPQSTGAGALALGLAAERADATRLCRWNPQDVRGADSSDGWFAVQLLGVHGPADANFALWQADGVHPPVAFMSTHDGGITTDDVVYISAGSHMHMNWGFTKVGLYEVDFRISTIVHCEEWLTADWAPRGDESFQGDCVVDFRDFALLSSRWLEVARGDDADTWMFLDPNDRVDMTDLTALGDQWLACGYPGCQNDSSTIDPNDANKTLTTPSR